MRNLILFILLFPFIISCRTPRYCYAPSRANVPLMSEKNEMQLDGSLPVIRGFDASAAYCLASHLGVMLNGSWKNDHQKFDGTSTNELLPPEKVQYHRSSIDLGIGYFANGSNGLHVECYGGIGKGKFSIDDYGHLSNPSTPYTRYYYSKLDRLFIQPAFGITRRDVQVALFARFLFQRYHDLQTDYSTDEMVYYNIPRSPSTFYSFIEPGWLLRIYPPGLKPIGFEYNFMFCGQSGPIPESVPIQMSLGIHVRFSTAPNR